MIGYVTLGSNDLARAGAFYDALLEPLAGRRVMEVDRLIAWGRGDGSPVISVLKPFDGEPATVGNGVMVALKLDSPEAVQALHAKALSLGATNEGDPGLRKSGFYCAYVRDLDGNKLNFFYY